MNTEINTFVDYMVDNFCFLKQRYVDKYHLKFDLSSALIEFFNKNCGELKNIVYNPSLDENIIDNMFDQLIDIVQKHLIPLEDIFSNNFEISEETSLDILAKITGLLANIYKNCKINYHDIDRDYEFLDKYIHDIEKQSETVDESTITI